MRPSNPRAWGYVAIVTASVIFGAWAVVGKLLVAVVAPLLVAFFVHLIGSAVFVPFARRSDFTGANRKLLVLIIVVGSTIGPILYFVGIQRTTATNAALLSNTEALFTILIAFAFLGERLARRSYVAIAAIALGAFLVATDLNVMDAQGGEFLLGNVMLIAAGLAWAANNNAVTILSRRIRIRSILALQLSGGSALLFPIALAFGPPVATAVPFLPFLVLAALVGTVAFSVLFYYSFRAIGPTRTGAVLSTSALWGVLTALLVFPGVGLTIWQIVGGALMVPALMVLYFTEPRPAAKRWPAPRSEETLKPAASNGPKSP